MKPSVYQPFTKLHYIYLTFAAFLLRLFIVLESGNVAMDLQSMAKYYEDL